MSNIFGKAMQRTGASPGRAPQPQTGGVVNHNPRAPQPMQGPTGSYQGSFTGGPSASMPMPSGPPIWETQPVPVRPGMPTGPLPYETPDVYRPPYDPGLMADPLPTQESAPVERNAGPVPTGGLDPNASLLPEDQLRSRGPMRRALFDSLLQRQSGGPG